MYIKLKMKREKKEKKNFLQHRLGRMRMATRDAMVTWFMIMTLMLRL